MHRVRKTVVRFFGDHLRNKIQISFICDVERVSPTTGLVMDDDQTGFNSKQESIFASTDMEATYQRMATTVLRSFAEYLAKKRKRLATKKSCQVGHYSQQVETSQRLV